MLFSRFNIASLFLAITATSQGSADACWLTDWLYGRQAAPYAVGYAPSYTAGYAPIAATPYSANLPLSSYSAAYAPTTSLPAVTPVMSSGAYQAQRPAYSNPSVYTGAPVGTNVQTAYSVPISTTPQLLRGTQPLLGNGPTSSYLGASNIYPNSSYYRSNYAAAQVGLPASAMPATPVAPLFPNAPATPVRSGLGRFFGSLFGTNYQSSYYRAPVTYYRPATSVDPLSGTTVTVQQPCTSTVQQLQRTPYNSFQLSQPALPPVTPMNGPGCGTSPMYGQATPSYQPSTYGPPSAVGQASISGVSPGQFTVPIPSTAPSQPSYGGYGPSTAPLTGSPANPQWQSDQTPVDPPSLNSYQRNETSYRSSPPSDYQPPNRTAEPSRTEKPESYWKLQDADDSTAMMSPAKRYGAVRPDFQSRQSQPSTNRRPPSFTGIQPIRALEDDEPSPFSRQRTSAESARSYDVPQLPARSIQRSVQQSTSYRLPVREVALTTRNAAMPSQAPTSKRRDNTWSKAK